MYYSVLIFSITNPGTFQKVKVQIEECVNNSNEQSVSSEEQAEGFDMSNLDLTGCPLQVDLRDDSLQTTLMFDRPNNWTTDEEVNHIPITLSQARCLSKSIAYIS